MPKILVLEDDSHRIDQFINKWSKYDLTITETADECIKKLKENEYDLICLDHDLGGNVFCLSDEKSGYHVAKWISENPQKTRPHVIFHTYNENGMKNMSKVLPYGIYIPFSPELFERVNL